MAHTQQHTIDSTTNHAAASDTTDLNVSTSAHGLCPKLSNDAGQFLDGTGSWSTPTMQEVYESGADITLNATGSNVNWSVPDTYYVAFLGPGGVGTDHFVLYTLAGTDFQCLFKGGTFDIESNVAVNIACTAGQAALLGSTQAVLQSSTGTVLVSALNDITFGARNQTITLNEAGDEALSGFYATSIIGALNELKAGGSGSGVSDLQEAYEGGATITTNSTGGNAVWTVSANGNFEFKGPSSTFFDLDYNASGLQVDASVNLMTLVSAGDLTLTSSSGTVKCTSEFQMKVYSQTSEPTLGADDNLAIWEDTDDSNRIYLVYRRGTSDQVSVELA